MSNPCGETLPTFHFPEAIKFNFVLKFHTYSILLASTPHK